MSISTPRPVAPEAGTVARARGLMVLGTASHVGKSLIAAALCRIFADDGRRVLPFKAQNMSLNSAATPDGGEIGRAQALQAEAARVPASVDMNPVLLKPMSDQRSQVVVLGRPAGESDARGYHTDRVNTLFPIVTAAYERLARNADVIVLEGAGSPAEINLRSGDIVNLRMAEAADAACLLVADIDRGGMFAALAGTLLLLEPHERERIRAFIVNKFRGDIRLLQPGIDMIVERLGVPCAGVIPYVHALGLDEEDGVSFAEVRRRSRSFDRDDGPDRRLRVAVIAFPHLANYTDFDALDAEPTVHVRYVDTPAAAADADVLVIPGSKATIADYDWLVATGLAPFIVAHAGERKPLLGICAGMQMLGRSVSDPHAVEGGGQRETLGLLALDTTLLREKTTRLVHARYEPAELFGRPIVEREITGYEIHMGKSIRGADTAASTAHEYGADGAARAGGTIVGTSIHGFFDNDAFRHAAISAARAAAGLHAPTMLTAWRSERDGRLDAWAAHVRAHLDMPLIATLIAQ